MSATEQEREEQTVSGRVTSIITKGADVWQVAVQPPDSQYTKNLWTKDGMLVGQMGTMIGRELSFFCNVSHWTNQSGQPVRSLWINGWVEGSAPSSNGEMQTLDDPVAQAQEALRRAQAAAEAAAQAAAAPQPTPTPPPSPGPPPPKPEGDYFEEKEMRIMREAADKCSAWILAAMIATGQLQASDLTPERLHSFMDAFANRRVNFYQTGQHQYTDEVPFAYVEPNEPGVHMDPWRP